MKALYNVKVLKLKMLLATLGVDIDALPEKLGMTSYRWNWLTKEMEEEDRLSTMKKSELLLLGIVLKMDAKELSNEYGLGDPSWYESLPNSDCITERLAGATTC